MIKTSHILTHLNLPQQEAVTFGEGPLLILAGPGSGKTRALTHRAAYLIKDKKVAPENILLLTFTNKASEEMKKRIKKLAGVTPQFAGTFHSFCAKILRIEGKSIGLPKNYLIYDEKDQLDTIKLAMAEIDVPQSNFKPIAILNAISQAKNELIPALEYPQYAQGYFQTTVARIYLTYQRLLKEYQALDFDDLLMETVHLFQKNREILGKYQSRFLYLLIDEYQDTNQAQYVLTKLLAGKWRNLCVVGDASQAIYGFRGANYRNLINLQKDFSDLKIINLEQNYRSTQIILNAAHEVIKRNTTHPILKLWTDKNSGDLISLYKAKNEVDEAAFIINAIQESLLKIPSRSLGDFAVLYRTNAQSRVLEESFLHAGMLYILAGGTRFYDRKEIKDCLAYLRLIANSKDKVSYQRIEKLGKKRLKKFLNLSKKISRSDKPTTLQLLDKVIEETQYLDLYGQNDEDDLSRLENIKELRSVASEFPVLSDFLENVSLIEKETPITTKESAVTLMTAHAAKGTEFPTVFMVGMEEGLFPHARSLMEKEGIEEERRLCYVGITRAKEKLYLSYTHRRLYFGQHSSNPISRFVTDIPQKLIEFVNEL